MYSYDHRIKCGSSAGRKGADIILRSDARQVVVVYEDRVKAFPKSLYGPDRNYLPLEEAEKGRRRAAHDVRTSSQRIIGSVQGFGLFNPRYLTFDVYVITPSDHLLTMRMGGVYDADDVERVVREQQAKIRAKTEAETVRELEQELKRHDWFGAMSDDARYWRASEQHMNEVIMPLLVALPEAVGLRIWRKYAPEGHIDNPYR